MFSCCSRRPLFIQECLPPDDVFGRKDFLHVEPKDGLSFLIRLSEPRFA